MPLGIGWGWVTGDGESKRYCFGDKLRYREQPKRVVQAWGRTKRAACRDGKVGVAAGSDYGPS
jgi:hypothetical protein